VKVHKNYHQSKVKKHRGEKNEDDDVYFCFNHVSWNL